MLEWKGLLEVKSCWKGRDLLEGGAVEEEVFEGVQVVGVVVGEGIVQR